MCDYGQNSWKCIHLGLRYKANFIKDCAFSIAFNNGAELTLEDAFVRSLSPFFPLVYTLEPFLYIFLHPLVPSIYEKLRIDNRITKSKTHTFFSQAYLCAPLLCKNKMRIKRRAAAFVRKFRLIFIVLITANE